MRKGKDHGNFRHGHTDSGSYRSKTYRAWQSMLTRCENEKNRSYPRYGGRGITVCQEWHEFTAFLADMGEPPTDKHQVERKDNNLGYSKGNCRWATPKEQANNRSSSRLLTHGGKTQTVSAWSEELGIKTTTIAMRLNSYRWSIEKTLTTPARGWSPGRKKKPPG